MNIARRAGGIEMEIAHRDHPHLYAPRTNVLDAVWPSSELQQWVADHGGSWYKVNYSSLVVKFAKEEHATLFKLTFA